MALAIALGMGLVAPAFAQGPADEDGAQRSKPRDVIIVTARKQKETLQEVPVTVTAISGNIIDEFQYTKMEDLTARVPTLRIGAGGSGSGGQITLRGVGSSGISAAFDSAVAMDFDGVQVSQMRIVQSAIFDLAQVEVLKGPQSLYFGKSASAGVISFKSANPTDEFEVGGKASYEFEERGFTVEGYVSGPLSEKVGFRLAAQYNDVSKLFFNSAPGVADPKRGEKNINVRATFQFDPVDNFSANLKLNYVRHENDGALRFSAINCGDNGVADPVFWLSGAVVLPAGYACNAPLGTQFFFPDQAPPLAIQAPAEGPKGNGGVSYGNSDIFFGVLRMDWNLTDSLTLTSVTGYLDMSAQDLDQYSFGGIVNNESYAGGTGLTDNQLEQFSQELRLTSGFDGMFNFMLGAFYEHRHSEFNTSQNAVNISFFGVDPVTGNSFDWYKQHPTNGDAISIFGSASIDITDRLELSGGVRWTHEKKVNHILVPYVHTFLSSGPAFISSGFDSGPIKFTDSNVSPEVTLSYQATDDINLYAAFKTGFKSGGIDNSALPSANLLGFASDDPEVRAATASSLVYDSETTKGGEIGVKSQWADRSLTVNLSIYYYVFKDLQVQNFDAVAIQFQTSNAGEVTTKGVDLDFNWRTPVEGLSFFGSIAYTSAKFTGFFDPIPNNGIEENLQGRRVARAPKWSGNIGADLRLPVGNGLEFGLSTNLRFSGSYFTNEDSFMDQVQSGYVTLDLAVSIGEADGAWRFSVVANNVANKLFVTSQDPRPFLPVGGDDFLESVNRGRQVFVEGAFRF